MVDQCHYVYIQLPALWADWRGATRIDSPVYLKQRLVSLPTAALFGRAIYIPAYATARASYMRQIFALNVVSMWCHLLGLCPGEGMGGGAALSAWEPVVILVRCLTDLWHRYMIWWFASGEVLPLPHTNACGDSYHLGRNPYRPMCWFVFMQTYTVWHHCLLHARFVWELVNWVCSGLILTHPSHFLSSLAMTYFTNFNTKVTPCLCHARVCNITINPYIAPLCQVSYPLWQLNSFAMEHMKFWVLSQNNPEDPKLVMIKNRSTRIFY